MNRRTELAGLRGLAGRALAAYPVVDPRVRLVAHGWNTTYRVDSAAGTHLLRVHRAAITGVDQIEAELAWLDALARDTALPVPRVVRRRDGAPATVLDGRVCVLLSWTPGRFLETGLRPAHLHQVGGLLAALHTHTDRWRLPAGVTGRGLYGVDDASWRDPDQLDPATVDRVSTVAQGVYGEDSGAVVHAFLEHLRAVTTGLEGYGLLHGDLHQENFLFTPGSRVAAIDFDDCGFGHHAYDLAIPVAELSFRDDVAELRAALLAGYRAVRPLGDAAEAAIDSFIEMKRLQLMFWVIDRRHGDAADWWHRAVTKDLAALRSFLSGR